MKVNKRETVIRRVVLPVMFFLFAAGTFLSVRTTMQSLHEIYMEHEEHLLQLTSTVDHNIGMVLNRCRLELNDVVTGESFREIERIAAEDDGATVKQALAESTVLLSDYADRVLVRRGEDFVLSTAEGDSLDYSVLTDKDNDDIWVCLDNKQNKSYIALTCPSRENESVYYILIDVEPFFRQVVVDTIYEDYWVVLYDYGSGLTLQNDYNQPEYKLFTEEEILQRNDGFTRIYQRHLSGETGSSEYEYTDSEENKQTISIYVIPASRSENGILTVAVAAYNNHMSVPIRSMALKSVLSATLMAFSAAAALFLILHSGKRERELAHEIASLEQEKQLSDELINNQQRLVHHQKLETIGTLTSGIAHEFNNLLSPIMGNSMLIMEKTRITDPEIFDNALEAFQASDKARELILQISKLSRYQPANQMCPVSVEKIVLDVLSMSASSVPGNITVRKNLNTDGCIMGDETQLGYMLLNLVINAVQAMKPESGTLTVSADEDGENIRIAVEDTGKGIPEDIIQSIFDPFFTTKDVGKGTGLGLSIAQNTAINHGGSLTAENLPGAGAKFTFTVNIYVGFILN